MTVCIAAVAAGAKAIVVVADRSISYIQNGQTRFKADEGVRKIRDLSGGWVAAISGPLDFGEFVIFDADQMYLAAQEARKPISMPDCVKLAYQKIRKKYVIDMVLKPKMLSEEWFDEKIKNPISRTDDFFNAVVKEINDLFVETTIMLCGFEDDPYSEGVSPEIYTITNPGVLNSASSEAVCAIGIGQDTALSRLFALETDPSDSVAKVLYDVYDAKEACADFVPDVGRVWDVEILVSGKNPATPMDATKTIIENLYKSHPRSPFGKPDELAPKDWQEVLAEFSEWVMGDRTPETTVKFARANRGREDYSPIPPEEKQPQQSPKRNPSVQPTSAARKETEEVEAAGEK
ncbi:MAG TPA: hypothetical protein VGR52_00140 [Stellaceae bacterium]|nr:hypothetical protein [Stellaceae bacterium]